ncbi:uncharacterized protein PSFLO_02937 [Pseudozyma flocculosa]|uniref:DUF453-domain-containing protein n=2 Tax=Pseudozyma flocculosa TaxID=84751 RepID=A0A5C3EYV7_9BASI|nr:uncharacterized protein PSFLO_02937 [Pseudozyma flocculosa]
MNAPQPSPAQQGWGLAPIPCSFYRGGTSKGLLWPASTLARFPSDVRDKIICSAMGSPDPDKRQIDGLGGGISSLSKTAVVGPPSSSLSREVQRRGDNHRWVGDVGEWIDDEVRAAADDAGGWDVVYRFGQVPVEKGNQIDWSSTCGNLVSAVALFALQEGVVPQAKVRAHFARTQPARPIPEDGDTTMFPVRILAASSGHIVIASVPMIAVSSRGQAGRQVAWHPEVTGTTTISGVPGKAPGILVSTPLDTSVLLPTGRSLDSLTVQGHTLPLTVINAGLPTIFLPASSIPSSILDADALPTLSPSDLDANRPLMNLLEEVRQATATLSPALAKAMSPSAPKICLVHPSQPQGYATTGGQRVEGDEMHILIRAVSVGNVHRTVPATCLSALACGRAFADSTIEQAVRQSSCGPAAAEDEEGIRSISVGQPAGVSSASIRLVKADGGGEVPESIVYYRTARRIIKGSIDVPAELIRDHKEE